MGFTTVCGSADPGSGPASDGVAADATFFLFRLWARLIASSCLIAGGCGAGLVAISVVEWRGLSDSSRRSRSFLAAVARSIVAILLNGLSSPMAPCKMGPEMASFADAAPLAVTATPLPNKPFFGRTESARPSEGWRSLSANAISVRIGGNNCPGTGTPPNPVTPCPGGLWVIPMRVPLSGISGAPSRVGGLGKADIDTMSSRFKSSYRLGGYSEPELDRSRLGKPRSLRSQVVPKFRGDGASGLRDKGRALLRGSVPEKAVIITKTS